MTVSERVANTLQRDIFAGAIKPGERLPPERELAVSFKANRNAVREALKKLEQLGLVETRHGSGTTVKDYLSTGNMETLVGALASAPQSIPPTIWRDALDFRVYYAPAIAHLAATRGDAKKAHALAGAQLDMESAATAEQFASAEHKWMNVLAAASENQMFVIMQNTMATGFKEGTGLSAMLFSHRQDIERAYRKTGELVGAKDAPGAMSTLWQLMERERSWMQALLPKR